MTDSALGMQADAVGEGGPAVRTGLPSAPTAPATGCLDLPPVGRNGLEGQHDGMLRAQLEMDRLRRRYFDLFDQAPVGYCTLAVDGRFLESNLTASALLGIPTAALSGQPIARLIPPAEQASFSRLFAQLLDTGLPHTWETRMTRADGSIFWAQLGATVAADDAGGRICRVVISDVSERKAAELAAHAARLHLEILFRGARDAIFTIDAVSGLILDANPQAEVLLGRPRRELFGLHYACLHPPAQRQRAGEAFTRHVAGADGLVTSVMLHRDGRQVPVEISPSLVALPDGRRLVMGLVRDISERIRLHELELQRLEHLSSLGLLAGGIAHDVRNSLCGVVGIADGLRRYAHDPHLLRQAGLLAAAGEQANQLCEDLLRFARRGSQAPELFDAQAAVMTAVRVFGTGGRGTRVDLPSPANAPCCIYGNRNQFQSAVLNLCMNARDAMGGGGVIWITSSLRELGPAECAAALPYVLSPGPHLRLAVADTGCGMDAETLRRCCEPLFTTKGEAGTGLGLVSVQRMVLEHRGALEIASVAGTGTIVTLVLPAHPHPPGDPLPAYDPPPSDDLPRSPWPVLVVDDEPQLRANLVELLEASGYATVGLADGSDAIAWCRKHAGEAGMILLDLHMERMGGAAAVAALRAIEPAVPLWMMTAAAVDGTVTGLDMRLLDGLLPKPVSAERLLLTVASAIRREAR